MCTCEGQEITIMSLGCDREGGFYGIWRCEELETEGTKKKVKKKLPNMLGYINSAPLFLIPFHSLFFQNRCSPLSSVESKKEMGNEVFAISESHLHSHLHRPL